MDGLSRAAADLRSSDPARAEAAVSALAALGEAAVSVLRPMLRSPSPETRWWAIRAAAELPNGEGAELLRHALEDSDLDVRRAAALGLRLHPSPQAASRLIDLLADPDDLLRRLASDALTAIGEPAVPQLELVLTTSGSPRAGYAARALAQMRNRAAIPALFAALEHDSHLAVHWAERGLEDLGVGMVFVKQW